jgi:hypothetical protein
MRIRLTAIMTAAMLLLPVAAASASLSTPNQPDKKCSSAMNFIFNHCD